MTEVLRAAFWPWSGPHRTQDKVRTAPERRSSLVFIHDAVTPWRGETMLLDLLRNQSESGRDQS